MGTANKIRIADNVMKLDDIQDFYIYAVIESCDCLIEVDSLLRVK